MGASFGATRALSFVHEATGREYTFLQDNGDVFLFDDKVDAGFLHGVYPSPDGQDVGPRISVIMMGRRRAPA